MRISSVFVCVAVSLLPAAAIRVPDVTRLAELVNDGGLPPKKDLVNFVLQMACALPDCNLFIYYGYGCHCGLGHRHPDRVVDGIDLCCKEHDRCYDRTCCPKNIVKTYRWNCVNRIPVCLDQPSCEAEQCECDRRMALCVKRYPCPRTQKSCF